MLFPDIYPVSCHTKHIGPGSTFVAIKGYSVDGFDYIQDALKKGASTIIIDEKRDCPEIRALCSEYNAGIILTPNTRKALASHSAAALNHPAKKLKIIGITGTKGKTSTTYLTEYFLRSAGYKTALVSSIINRIGNNVEHSNHTTPESDYLQMFFAACVQKGIEYVVIEVSSHALSLDRVDGIEFTSVAFTNLMHDHLDFHNTMDEYFDAKAAIFDRVKSDGKIIINLDHDWGAQAYERGLVIAKKRNCTIITLSQDHADARILKLTSTIEGLHFELAYNGIFKLSTKALFGAFNATNISVAFLIGLKQGVAADVLISALKNFSGVPGRLQHHILKNGAHAFVDYAHNGPSVLHVLSTLRQHTNHLITVFGCGGNKYHERRSGMGASAAAFSDVIIITNDNPRYEEPGDIIKDIIQGIPADKRDKIIIEPNRKKAIEVAAQLAQPTSIIALLGKGHENYYIVKDQVLHFDDYEEISTF